MKLDVPFPLTYGLQRVELEFTTLGKNGLIFLGMDPPYIFEGAIGFDPAPVNFYALQLEDGYLVSLFDFGAGPVRVKHTNTGRVNEGRVHNITLKGKSRFVRLWVDQPRNGEKTADISLSGRPKFKVSKAFIGGLPMNGYTPHA